jgi:hypothetical protein
LGFRRKQVLLGAKVSCNKGKPTPSRDTRHNMQPMLGLQGEHGEPSKHTHATRVRAQYEQSMQSRPNPFKTTQAPFLRGSVVSQRTLRLTENTDQSVRGPGKASIRSSCAPPTCE